MDLKRVKKQKHILIKRKFFLNGTYDFIWVNKNEGEKIIESTKELKNRDYQFVRAKKRIEIWFRLKKLFDNKNIQKITWLLIGMLISVLGKLVINLLNIKEI